MAATTSWVERARDAARDLVVREAPEPRIAQTLLLVLVIADLGLRSVGEGTFEDALGTSPWPGLGFSLILFAQVIAAVTPWQRLPGWVLGALPMLDIAGLGLLRLTPEGTGAGILAILPAIWLVWQFGLRGLAILAGGSALFLAAAPLAFFGLDAATASRSLLDPLVVTLIGGAVWALLTGARERQAEAASRSQELAAALEELSEARAFASAIFESVDVGLVLLARQGEYLTTNTRHRQFLDLAFPEGHTGAAGQLGEVFAADGVRRLARHEMPSWRAAQGEEFDGIRMWVGADPETRRALSVSARTVRDQQGRVRGAALAYTDVTDFMRAIAVKDDFVAMVSHEFRTPLTSINGYIDLLLDEEERLASEDVRYLRVVARNTERLERLVSDLLSSARFDGRSLELETIPADVTDVVRNAVDAARPAAEAKGLALHADLPRTLTALIDPQRIAQVADNLLSNAVKYTPAGGRVSVSLSEHGDHAELRIADTGMGIRAADRDRLFTRFFRTDAAEASSVQGVGLGLSITKKIVDAHGGRIDVESDASGSTFTVWLPVAPVFQERAGDQAGAGTVHP